MQFFRKYPITTAVVAAIAVVLGVSAVGSLAGERKVKVLSGGKTICVYGETLKNSVRSLWVPESRAGSYKVVTKRVLCDRHRLAQQWFQKGQALAKQGKPKQALQAFKKVAKYDPKFKDVETWIASDGKHGDKASASGNSANTGGSSTSADSGDSDPTGTSTDSGVIKDNTPVDAASLIPASLTGYDLINSSAGKTEASREYRPVDKKAIPARVLIIRTYDRGSWQKAAAFVRNTSRRVYPGNRKTVKRWRGVNAYFGTQSTLYATFAWARGRGVRELLMESSTGRPKDLFNIMEAVAQKVK